MENEKKFAMYLTILRFLAFKITPNLWRIFADINLESSEILLTAVYRTPPIAIELDLLDDLVTNSMIHILDYEVTEKVVLKENFDELEKHDFVVFATFDELDNAEY